MTRAQRIIPRRRTVFLGCEGESGQAYAQVLYDIIREQGIDVHLEIVLLSPGAGSPSAKIKLAAQKIAEHERKREKFWSRAVLLDSDLVDNDASERNNTEQLASSSRIFIVWQKPCHEAFLLRHLPNCKQLRPPTSALAASTLRAEWPGYEKPMTRIKVAKVVGRSHVWQAASAESELRSFLTDIGWQE